MTHVEERYNIRQVEARWRSEDRCRAGGPPRGLSEARAWVATDVLARFGRRAAPSPCLTVAPVTGADAGTDILIDAYGHDALRLALLSDVAPHRPLAWSDGLLDGAWRYLHRLWRLGTAIAPGSSGPPLPPALLPDTIAEVEQDLALCHFHKAIARLRALSHALAVLPDCAARTAGLAALVRMFAPILPHLCAELWQRLGYRQPVADSPWPAGPQAVPALAPDVVVAIQVNGRRRGELRLPRDAGRPILESAALALPAVARITRGRPPRQVIVVPNRILNVVI